MQCMNQPGLMTVLLVASTSASSTADTKPKPGNKIIHLVRHAQGYHNLSKEAEKKHDPELTDKGKSQCSEVADTFPTAQLDSVNLIAASPLRRTLCTALYCFPKLFTESRGMHLLALPGAQETDPQPCDTGSEPEILKKAFADKPIDFSLLTDEWNSNEGPWANSKDSLAARAARIRTWLRNREEEVIILVTHGGFLHYLTENWKGYDEDQGTAWKNCEWRTYEFTAPEDQKHKEQGPIKAEVDGEGGGKGDEDLALAETSASKERRGAAKKD